LHDALSELLRDLKIAIHHSLANDTVFAAMAALDKAGHEVNVAVDFTVISEGSEEDSKADPSLERVPEPDLEFSPSDALFLRLLRIAT
jgi:hypothetical protein